MGAGPSSSVSTRCWRSRLPTHDDLGRPGAPWRSSSPSWSSWPVVGPTSPSRVDVDDDGGGLVTVVVRLDVEAAARTVWSEGTLPLDRPARTAGWTVTDPVRQADGGAVITATKGFSQPDQLAAVLAQVSGPDGPLQGFQLRAREVLRQRDLGPDGHHRPARRPRLPQRPRRSPPPLGGNPLGYPPEVITQLTGGQPLESVVGINFATRPARQARRATAASVIDGAAARPTTTAPGTDPASVPDVGKRPQAASRGRRPSPTPTPPTCGRCPRSPSSSPGCGGGWAWPPWPWAPACSSTRSASACSSGAGSAAGCSAAWPVVPAAGRRPALRRRARARPRRFGRRRALEPVAYAPVAEPRSRTRGRPGPGSTMPPSWTEAGPTARPGSCGPGPTPTASCRPGPSPRPPPCWPPRPRCRRPDRHGGCAWSSSRPPGRCSSAVDPVGRACSSPSPGERGRRCPRARSPTVRGPHRRRAAGGGLLGRPGRARRPGPARRRLRPALRADPHVARLPAPRPAVGASR